MLRQTRIGSYCVRLPQTKLDEVWYAVWLCGQLVSLLMPVGGLQLSLSSYCPIDYVFDGFFFSIRVFREEMGGEETDVG